MNPLVPILLYCASDAMDSSRDLNGGAVPKSRHRTAPFGGGGVRHGAYDVFRGSVGRQRVPEAAFSGTTGGTSVVGKREEADMAARRNVADPTGSPANGRVVGRGRAGGSPESTPHVEVALFFELDLTTVWGASSPEHTLLKLACPPG